LERRKFMWENLGEEILGEGRTPKPGPARKEARGGPKHKQSRGGGPNFTTRSNYLVRKTIKRTQIFGNYLGKKKKRKNCGKCWRVQPQRKRGKMAKGYNDAVQKKAFLFGGLKRRSGSIPGVRGVLKSR